jgi:putative ABC transport system permease protein
MTLLGAAMGISAFVSLTSVGNGFRSQLGDLIRSYNIDITVTSKGAATPAASTIPLSDYHRLLKLRDVSNLSSLIVGPVTSPWNRYFLLFGISSVETFLNKFGMIEGRVFTPGSKEMILGERVAERFNVKVNDKVMLADQKMFTVTGIYASGSRIVDGAAVIDIRNAQELLGRHDSINIAFVQVAHGSDPREVVDDINRQFSNLSAVRSGEFIGQVRVIRTVDVFAWVVSLISLITCCVIVMNTFLMTVTERTKEIGLLRAVGWSRIMIMRMIISESVMVCFLGGILGNLVALAELWFFYSVNPEGLGWLVSTSFSVTLFWESIGLSLLLGIIGSLYPAIRASRLLPAEALRCE